MPTRIELRHLIPKAAIMAERYQIVHLEDNPLDAELIALKLARDGVQADVRVTHSAEGFEAALRELVPDVILADYALPGYDGLRALAYAHQYSPHVPFV